MFLSLESLCHGCLWTYTCLDSTCKNQMPVLSATEHSRRFCWKYAFFWCQVCFVVHKLWAKYRSSLNWATDRIRRIHSLHIAYTRLNSVFKKMATSKKTSMLKTLKRKLLYFVNSRQTKLSSKWFCLLQLIRLAVKWKRSLMLARNYWVDGF